MAFEVSMINKFFKSIIDSDEAPVVICDAESVVVYMNPAAIQRYRVDLTGRSIFACHSKAAAEKIMSVLDWFAASPDNNRVYTFRNDEENKDVYMVALRDGEGRLIGYYEKHEYREREVRPLYEMR